jgi:hypothetical protein
MCMQQVQQPAPTWIGQGFEQHVCIAALCHQSYASKELHII